MKIKLTEDGGFVTHDFSDDGVAADADDASTEELEAAAKIHDETFNPYGDSAEDCPHKGLHRNLEGLTGLRGELITQSDFDELSPTQLTGLRALNAERRSQTEVTE